MRFGNVDAARDDRRAQALESRQRGCADDGFRVGKIREPDAAVRETEHPVPALGFSAGGLDARALHGDVDVLDDAGENLAGREPIFVRVGSDRVGMPAALDGRERAAARRRRR